MTLDVTDPMGPTEHFYTVTHYFMEFLAMLAADPGTTCALAGDYNTAWELKHDVLREGETLLRLWPDRLTEHQRAALESLVRAVTAVPAQDLTGGAGRENNLCAMEHESWTPARAAANALLPLLAPLAQESREYFADNRRAWH